MNSARRHRWSKAKRLVREASTKANDVAQGAARQITQPAERQGKVLVVNGDATFLSGKAQNFLTDDNVRTLADAFHGFADVEKLARVVPVEEIESNAFNLNISRYVQTGADAEAVDVAAEVAKLQDLIAKRNEAEAVMFGHLKRLGYVG